MKVMGYDVTLEIDGVESLVQLDDTYPSVENWHTATEFAIMLAQELHPDAKQIEFVECGEYELEEYASYGYIHDTPMQIM